MADSPTPFRLDAPRRDFDPELAVEAWDENTRTQQALKAAVEKCVEQVIRSNRRIARMIVFEVLAMVLAAWIGVATMVRHLDAAAAQREEQRSMLAAALAAQVAVTDVQLEAETVDAELVESVEPIPAPAVVVAPASKAVVQKRAAAREQVRATLRMLEDPPHQADASRPE